MEGRESAASKPLTWRQHGEVPADRLRMEALNGQRAYDKHRAAVPEEEKPAVHLMELELRRLDTILRRVLVRPVDLCFE